MFGISRKKPEHPERAGGWPKGERPRRLGTLNMAVLQHPNGNISYMSTWNILNQYKCMEYARFDNNQIMPVLAELFERMKAESKSNKESEFRAYDNRMGPARKAHLESLNVSAKSPVDPKVPREGTNTPDPGGRAES